MPVLVTGPETAVGRAAVDAFLHTGGQVRTYVDPEVAGDGLVDELRRAGCYVARGPVEDETKLEFALEQVHTVVHLGGGPLAEPDDEVDEAASVLSAAIGARCRRLIWLSHLGAESPGGNAYLQACAEVEEMLADAPLETVVIRRALTYGPSDPLTAVLARGSGCTSAGDARHAPVFAGDLAAAAVLADRQRGGPGGLHLVVSIAGPEEITLSELARRLAPVAAVAAAGIAVPPVLPDRVTDLLGRDLVRSGGTFGAEGTTVDEAVRRMAS